MVDFLTHSEILQTANYDVDKVVAHLRQLSYTQYLEVFQDYYKMMLTRKSTRYCSIKTFKGRFIGDGLYSSFPMDSAVKGRTRFHYEHTWS